MRIENDFFKGIKYVICGNEAFQHRSEIPMPANSAWCRKCTKESAKVIYGIYMNGNPAYALKCKYCGSEYPMYKSDYQIKYVGTDIAGVGRIDPTHGTKSRSLGMSNHVRQKLNKQRDEKCQEIYKLAGFSDEEIKESKKKFDERERQIHKQFVQSTAERRAQYEKEKIKKESQKRKDLIEKGIFKYVKGIGLVNQETGEVVKL